MVYNNWRFFKEQKCLILYNASFSGAFLILVDLRSSCLLACGCLLVCRCGRLISFSCGWLIWLWLVDFIQLWLVDLLLSVNILLSLMFLYNVVNFVANKQGYSEKFDSFFRESLKRKKIIHTFNVQRVLLDQRKCCLLGMGNNCYTFCTRSFFFGKRYNLWL